MLFQKILVADDSRTVRMQVERTLTEAGYEVVTASSGVEAVDQIRRESPGLVVLDINMPDMDGYGVVQALKAMGPPWDRTPIVLLTTMQSHALEVLGGQLGAYLHKPVGPDQLLQAVKAFAPMEV